MSNDTPLEVTMVSPSLHDQIMWLPGNPPKDANVNQAIGYMDGHRDARHAAAELVAAHEADQAAPVAVPDWSAIHKFVEQYVTEYELNDYDGASHTPTEFEGLLILDAAIGLIDSDEFRAMLSTAPTPPAQQPVAAWDRTLGDALKKSGLDIYIAEGDLAHMMAISEFARIIGSPAQQRLSAIDVLTDACEEALAWFESRTAGIAIDAKDSLRTALAAAKNDAAAQQSQWVPVSERMPELDTPVWLYDPEVGTFFGMRSSSTDGWDWVEGQHLDLCCQGGPGFAEISSTDLEPTLWMPLPAAPGDTAAPTPPEGQREISEFDLEDMARIAFEEAMSFGVNLDSFVRLANSVAEAVAPTPPAQQSHIIRAAYEVLLGCVKRPEIAALIDAPGVEKIAKQLNDLLPGYGDTAATEQQQDAPGRPVRWAEIEAICWKIFEDGTSNYRGCTKERLEELHVMLTAAPEQGIRDAYVGAREDLAIWKRRALEAEAALRKEQEITGRLSDALNGMNGPTFMGEPVLPAPEQAEQPYGTTSDKYRAELYDEVWQKARDMGYGNVTEALVELERIKEQAEQPRPVNRSVIRDVFLRNGFTIKEGHSDLKPYVYAAAEELLALDGKAVAVEQDAVKVPAGITIDRDLMGTMHIKCGDFDFIQIQYQYPYTDNASTRRLAEQIAALLGGDA